MSDKEMKTKKARQEPVTAGDAADAGSFPISTRLSEAQKRWVEEAANIKGWTPANFIRQAAVEKAVHLLNTHRPNKFDFDTGADKAAKQLCKPRYRIAEDEDSDWVNNDDIITERFTIDDIRAMREAVRLGGAEFTLSILERCLKLLEPPSRAELPDPIQPE